MFSQSVIVKHCMTPTKGFSLCTINTTLLARMQFSTDTIVTVGYYHIHCFSPIKGYNSIINKIDCSPIVQNIPFRTIIFPFKTEDVISCYNFIALMKKLYIFLNIHLPKPELFCKLFKDNQSCIWIIYKIILVLEDEYLKIYIVSSSML